MICCCVLRMTDFCSFAPQGEEGSGKTRLVKQLRKIAEEQFDLPAIDLDVNSSTMWRAALLDLLEAHNEDFRIKSQSRQSTLIQHFIARLQPDLEPYASLLNSILGLTIPPSAELTQLFASGGMTDKKQIEYIQQMMIVMLKALTLKDRVALIVDDAHRLDDISLSLLLRISDEAGDSIVTLVSMRPRHELRPDVQKRSEAMKGFPISSMAREDCIEMVKDYIGADRLEQEVCPIVGACFAVLADFLIQRFVDSYCDVLGC